MNGGPHRRSPSPPGPKRETHRILFALGPSSRAGSRLGRIIDLLRSRGCRADIYSGTAPLRPGEADSFASALEQGLPETVAILGGNPDARAFAVAARARGIGVAVILENSFGRRSDPIELAAAVAVPSRFAAEIQEAASGVRCTILPAPIDWDGVAVAREGPGYVTFVDPSVEHGVFAFARIADELGRRRPDIPLLVVEGEGGEETLAGCGLDLRARGNVHLMAPTPDPRDYWRVAEIAIIPSLGRWDSPPAAVEAMRNGVPVVASDRCGLPEMLGDAGITLPLPGRLTPATRLLPDAEEISPWVEAVIRLWDDPYARAEVGRACRRRSQLWHPEVLAARWAEFFDSARHPASQSVRVQDRRAKWVALVPYLHSIEPECDEPLRQLERAGVTVVRCRGSSAIDLVRNTLLSEALHRGFESILFIDADIGFDPVDALRILARPEDVVAGVYAKKGVREFASTFAPALNEATFGPDVLGLYPLEHAAAGFLRIRSGALRLMIEALNLPLCNSEWGRGFWPFFLPMIAPRPGGNSHYLSEDWAFSHRLRQLGIGPLADTSIRLFHVGSYGFTLEDATSKIV